MVKYIFSDSDSFLKEWFLPCIIGSGYEASRPNFNWVVVYFKIIFLRVSFQLSITICCQLMCLSCCQHFFNHVMHKDILFHFCIMPRLLKTRARICLLIANWVSLFSLWRPRQGYSVYHKCFSWISNYRPLSENNLVMVIIFFPQ